MEKVLIFGSFDILHFGHIHLFKHASEYGDSLSVVVAREENIKKHKKLEPFHTEKERVDMLKSISIIDEVLLGDEDDVYKIIDEVRPNTIALGYDQRLFVDKIAEKITEYGLNTRIVRIPAYRPDHCKTNNIRVHLNKSV